MNLPQSKYFSITGPVKQKTLTYLDILNFNNLRKIAATKYPNMTSLKNDAVLKSLLKTAFSSYFSFTWTNNQNRTFLFEYKVDVFGTVTEFIAGLYSLSL